MSQEQENVSKSVISKILHDLASPLTVLNFLADTYPEFKDTVEEMTWRFKCLRHIFLSTDIPPHEAEYLSKHVKINLKGEEYSKVLIILAYLFKSKSVILHVKHHVLTLLKADIKHGDEILIQELDKELKRFNMTLSMV